MHSVSYSYKLPEKIMIKPFLISLFPPSFPLSLPFPPAPLSLFLSLSPSHPLPLSLSLSCSPLTDAVARKWLELDHSEIEKQLLVVSVHLFSPFLFGHAHQSDRWLRWCHEVGLLVSELWVPLLYTVFYLEGGNHGIPPPPRKLPYIIVIKFVSNNHW